MDKVVDITIIGAGPVGLYGAYYAGQRSLSTVIIDSLPEVGGQLWALYPENIIHDVAGVPEQRARDFIAGLKKQTLGHKPEIRLGETVTGVAKEGDIFTVTTDKSSCKSRSVLLAVGPGAFIPTSIYDCAPGQQREKGLFIELDDVTELADRDVLICGGKEEAIGWAIDAATVAASVTVINWSDILCADEARIDTMFTRHVDIMIPYELIEIHGKDKVTAATVARYGDGDTTRLKVDAVLMARGQLTNLAPIKKWGPRIEHNGVVVDRSMHTSVPGLFAAGDIVRYSGKVKSISSGAGEAATAVNNLVTFLIPDEEAQPGYTAK